VKRDKTGTEPGDTAPLSAVLEERRRYALRDLEELAVQVATGELDEATAARLRAGYEAELAAVEQAVSEQADEQTAVEEEAPARPADSPLEGRSTGRAIAGAFILIGALTVVILLAAQVFQSDDGPGSQAASDGSALDAAAIAEMEEVVAAHPDVPGMRLALADLYFEQGDYGSAIDHYLTVLAGEMTVQEESHTMGRIGWMAYSTGQINAAVDYLNASLSADPGYHEGKLFLGMVTLYGLEDAAGALPLLEEVRALPNLNEQVRTQVEDAIRDAESVLESP
jgi:tetratricopeptide (TPR) repeat protein